MICFMEVCVVEVDVVCDKDKLIVVNEVWFNVCILIFILRIGCNKCNGLY